MRRSPIVAVPYLKADLAHHPAFSKNLELVTRVTELARKKNATPGQLALAWVLARGEDIVPIPGTKRRSYLEENAAASQIELSADDLAQLDELAPKGVAAGTRYQSKRNCKNIKRPIFSRSVHLCAGSAHWNHWRELA